MEPANLFRDVRTIIFDLDGTLIATDRLEHESWQRALSQWGKRLTLEAYRSLTGASRRETARAIVNHTQLQAKWTELAEVQEREWLAIAKRGRIPVIKPAVRFLKAIPRPEYFVMFVTAFPAEHADLLLTRIGIARLADAILSGDSLRAKPKPDLYVAALDTAAVKGWNSVVIESSPAGVASAVRAGARVVAVPNEITRGRNFSAAHILVDSLDQLTPFLPRTAAVLPPKPPRRRSPRLRSPRPPGRRNLKPET